ncbi:ABC transporter permease [Saccharopolyspora pogona]|uniref:ABC transporter permease n=1 Tax=Saccharopolyspora pogona TaxID=333966 RepID=UPI001CC26835|nr:ABC transporter permease [Saccharopolyspora pogona]
MNGLFASVNDTNGPFASRPHLPKQPQHRAELTSRVIEHARNRLAMVLVVLFIPTWVSLAHAVFPSTALPFKLDATGELIAPAGNQITQITGAINAVTLITGFMMFAVTFNGGRFDRRRAMAGYPRIHLVLAKTTSLTLASAAIAAYATAVIRMAWSPHQPVLLAAALFCGAITYGAVGVVFGSLLRREVEGMFAMITVSLVDAGLQSPLAGGGTGSSATQLLPTYGTMQAAAAAGFTDQSLPGDLAVQLLWFTGAALLGLLAFHRRTKDALTAKSPFGLSWAPRYRQPARPAPDHVDAP